MIVDRGLFAFVVTCETDVGRRYMQRVEGLFLDDMTATPVELNGVVGNRFAKMVRLDEDPGLFAKLPSCGILKRFVAFWCSPHCKPVRFGRPVRIPSVEQQYAALCVYRQNSGRSPVHGTSFRWPIGRKPGESSHTTPSQGFSGTVSPHPSRFEARTRGAGSASMNWSAFPHTYQFAMADCCLRPQTCIGPLRDMEIPNHRYKSDTRGNRCSNARTNCHPVLAEALKGFQ